MKSFSRPLPSLSRLFALCVVSLWLAEAQEESCASGECYCSRRLRYVDLAVLVSFYSEDIHLPKEN